MGNIRPDIVLLSLRARQLRLGSCRREIRKLVGNHVDTCFADYVWYVSFFNPLPLPFSIIRAHPLSNTHSSLMVISSSIYSNPCLGIIDPSCSLFLSSSVIYPSFLLYLLLCHSSLMLFVVVAQARPYDTVSTWVDGWALPAKGYFLFLF